MCSIQDLIANTSDSERFFVENNLKNNSSHSTNSINEVGLPAHITAESAPTAVVESTYASIRDKLSTSLDCGDNVYDSILPTGDAAELYRSLVGRVLSPRSLKFLHSVVQNRSAEPSHDYENIPMSGAYRAPTGVRHWRAYNDIQSREHDYSTYRRKSLLDTTSHIYASMNNNNHSMSRHHSLPDLSVIASPSRAPQVPAPNYEAIWEEQSFHSDYNDALRNLYCSRLAELAGMKRNNSIGSRHPCRDVTNQPTPARNQSYRQSRIPQRSPLMRLVSRSQERVHERTHRAIQAGKRILQRPRVHTITPKKEIKRRDSYKEQLDPNILKKRSELSPKNKMILQEVSEMMNSNKTDYNRNSETGPKHSTPEGKHAPQISVLSGISSVGSPDEDSNKRFQRSISKVKNMSVIQELDFSIRI